MGPGKPGSFWVLGWHLGQLVITSTHRGRDVAMECIDRALAKFTRSRTARTRPRAEPRSLTRSIFRRTT